MTPNQTARRVREATLLGRLAEIDANKNSQGPELTAQLRRRAWEIAVTGEVAEQTQTTLSPAELRHTLFGNPEKR